MENFKSSILSETVTDYVTTKDASSDSGGSEVEAASSEESDEDIADSDNKEESEEEDSGNEDESEEEDSTPTAKGNAGWADAMSKILKSNKPKKKKTIVLSRAKTIQAAQVKEKKKEDYGFEIEGEIKEEKESIEESVKPKKLKGVQNVKRKEWESRGRVKPTLKDWEREKILSKIAIKGVVQLFNAVQKHQSAVENKLKDVGPSEIKRERVLKSIDKRAFLDVLMGNAKSEAVDSPPKTETKIKLKAEEPKSSAWSVLREDFLKDTSLKDWDKEPEVKEDDDIAQESLSSDEDVEMT